MGLLAVVHGSPFSSPRPPHGPAESGYVHSGLSQRSISASSSALLCTSNNPPPPYLVAVLLTFLSFLFLCFHSVPTPYIFSITSLPLSVSSFQAQPAQCSARCLSRQLTLSSRLGSLQRYMPSRTAKSLAMLCVLWSHCYYQESQYKQRWTSSNGMPGHCIYIISDPLHPEVLLLPLYTVVIFDTV